MSRRRGHSYLSISVTAPLVMLLSGSVLFAVHPVDTVRHAGLAVAMVALGLLLIGVGRVASRVVPGAVRQALIDGRVPYMERVVRGKLDSMRDGPTG